ncbi:hypothetical protein D3C80_2214810 [compost metagenome]
MVMEDIRGIEQSLEVTTSNLKQLTSTTHEEAIIHQALKLTHHRQRSPVVIRPHLDVIDKLHLR